MSDKQHLYLVDGSAYIFRAYHRLPPLTDPQGTPVGAVYGYTTMLWKLADDLHNRVTLWDFAGNPTGIAAAETLSALEYRPMMRSSAGVRDLLSGTPGRERQELVAHVGLDHHQRLHRSRHGDVEGVDVELVGVEALVRLVARPGVLQPPLQLGRFDARGALPELLGRTGHQVEEQDVVVLQPLGLLDREEERGGEGRPGRRLVLVA